MQIDYKELLPYQKDSMKNKAVIEHFNEQAVRHHEAKRQRRINQLVKIIFEEKILGGGYYSSPSKNSKVKRVM